MCRKKLIPTAKKKEKKKRKRKIRKYIIPKYSVFILIKATDGTVRVSYGSVQTPAHTRGTGSMKVSPVDI